MSDAPFGYMVKDGERVPVPAMIAAMLAAIPMDANPVPRAVTNFQARSMLMSTPSAVPGKSLFDLADAALKALGGTAWQAWEYNNEVTRDGVLVASIGAQLGLTGGQVDAMFRAAALIIA